MILHNFRKVIVLVIVMVMGIVIVMVMVKVVVIGMVIGMYKLLYFSLVFFVLLLMLLFAHLKRMSGLWYAYFVLIKIDMLKFHKDAFTSRIKRLNTIGKH